MTESFIANAIWQEKLFTGKWVSGSAKPVIVTEPASGKELGQIAMESPEDVSQSCTAAKKAFPVWSTTHFEERAAVLRKAAQVMQEHFNDITDVLIRESGSIRAKAEFEVSLSIKVLNESAALPSKSQGEVLPAAPGKISIARRKPLGVVGVISPFNFPLYLAIRAVAPALAVGNAVVLKPDPRTAVCGGVTIARVFELAGLPEGILHMLPGDGAAGATLTEHPDIAMIQFTGSTNAGKKVGEAASRHLKKVSLELGGKNSLIILDDADIDLAIANATWGAWLHQGQICMSTGRILVQRKIYQAFVSKLAEKAKQLPVGDPATEQVALGPIINEQQRDNISRILKAAVEGGAKIEAGGDYSGLFFQPTVLSSVTPESPAFNEEIFGPVAVVIPFDTDEEAAQLANQTEYGLSAGIIATNVGRALDLSQQLNTGLLHINDQTVNDEVVNPFGGTGASGNGTSVGGAANWEEFTQWQWLTIQSEAPRYPL